MATQTISFRTGPHRNGHGLALPMGSDIPVMRPRMNMTVTQAISELDEVLRELADMPCSFWACDGPSRPRGMVTCNKCWAMRKVARLRATMAAKSRTSSK